MILPDRGPGRDDLGMARRPLHLSFDRDADALISKDPVALLIGMVLDQQIPLEKAFRGPLDLSRRLGSPLDPASIAAMDPDRLAAIFSKAPSLHRYPSSMAARVQALCATIVDDYGGDAAEVWRGAPDANELLTRIKALPGFGDQKAKIFVALLGKQLGVTPPQWREVSAPFGEEGSTRSVADIVDKASLDQVRNFKQAMKAAHAAERATDGATATRAKTQKATKASKAGKNTRAPKATKAAATRVRADRGR